MIILFDDLHSYDDVSFREDLRCISKQRAEKVDRLRFREDKKCCLKAYMLLMKGLKDNFGINTAPEFVFGPCGKPALVGYPDIHFSLSHTRGAALCVIDSSPVGADVERIKPVEQLLLRSVCSPGELEKIIHAPSPDAAFVRCWTRKESFLKLTGVGITDEAQVKSTPSENSRDYRFETRTDPSKQFVYSVCQKVIFPQS